MFDFLRADLFFGGGGFGRATLIRCADLKKKTTATKKNPKPFVFPPDSEQRSLSASLILYKNPLVHRDVIMSKSQCGATFSAV